MVVEARILLPLGRGSSIKGNSFCTSIPEQYEYYTVRDVLWGNIEKYNNNSYILDKFLSQVISFETVIKSWDDLYSEYKRTPPIEGPGGSGGGTGGGTGGEVPDVHELTAIRLSTGNIEVVVRGNYNGLLKFECFKNGPWVTFTGPFLSPPNADDAYQEIDGIKVLTTQLLNKSNFLDNVTKIRFSDSSGTTVEANVMSSNNRNTVLLSLDNESGSEEEPFEPSIEDFWERNNLEPSYNFWIKRFESIRDSVISDGNSLSSSIQEWLDLGLSAALQVALGQNITAFDKITVNYKDFYEVFKQNIDSVSRYSGRLKNIILRYFQ